jgi:hypothetical protein
MQSTLMSTYRTRVLDPSEWPRLKGTEAEQLWPHLDPAKAQVMVVEKDGLIVASWVTMLVMHVECLWIAESERGRASAFRRLLRGLRRLAQESGFTTIATAADSELVRRMLENFGAVKIPADNYVFRVDALPQEPSCL